MKIKTGIKAGQSQTVPRPPLH